MASSMPALQTSTRTASGQRRFGTTEKPVKCGSLHLRSCDKGGGGRNGGRVTVEAVNGAVNVNGAVAVRVGHVSVAPPSSKDDGDAFGLGKFVERRLVYRQQFVIRSYEIGPDRTATMETLMNLLQVHKYIQSLKHFYASQYMIEQVLNRIITFRL